MNRTGLSSSILRICRHNVLGLASNNWAATQVRNLRRRPQKIDALPVPKAEKRLDVVIMGVPNVGKSVLLNALLKTKLAATSRKRHTTRRELLGAFNHRNTQLLFYDTPGYTKEEEFGKKDTTHLRKVAMESASKADVVLLVCDATKSSPKWQDAFADLAKVALQNAKLEVILVINKVDLIQPKIALLDITRTMVGLINYHKYGEARRHKAQLDTTTFMISALNNDGVLDLKNYLLSIAQPKRWLLGEEQGPTDMTNEERVEEIVLEMLMEHVHEEIPYIAKIYCRKIESLTDMRLLIDVDIFLQQPSQVRIVIGQFGRTINKVRLDATKELEQIFGKKVVLQLWTDDKIPPAVKEELEYRGH